METRVPQWVVGGAGGSEAQLVSVSSPRDNNIFNVSPPQPPHHTTIHSGCPAESADLTRGFASCYSASVAYSLPSVGDKLGGRRGTAA
jgi:hypothetical protein